MLIASTVLSLLLGTSANSAFRTSVPAEQWAPEAGDVLIVDTQANMGYLMHSDGLFFSFPVATGQRRVVRYIGRVYNATTPEASWVVKSIHTKGDRITFGPRGIFLRLYKGGKDATPYGIHGNSRSAFMMSQDVRFASMGCIIVTEDMLNIIMATYALNGDQLSVTTSYGLGFLQEQVAQY